MSLVFGTGFRLFHRYHDLAPQLVPLDYTEQPDVKLPYELIGSMPELKVARCTRGNPAVAPSAFIIDDQFIHRIP